MNILVFPLIVLIFSALASPALADSEIKIIQWSGDIRYRLAKSKEDVDDERKFQQLRARLGLRAEVNGKTQAVLRLATANSSISTNQTLGDSNDPGMSRRSFGLDLAYIDFKFADSGSIWGGRTANPFWSPGKTSLIYDSDLAFEGAAVKWEPKWSRSAAFANIGAFIISENYAAPTDDVDTTMLGGDFGYMMKISEISWTTHIGNYYFLGIQNKPITALDKDARIDPYSFPFDRYRGNTVYVNNPLLPVADRKYFFTHQFVLIEAGTELKQKMGNIEWSIYYDWVRNDIVSSQNVGSEYGLVFRWKIISLGVAFAKKQSDAVLGAFTDSDMNGGGTDNDGSRMSLGVQPRKNVNINLSQYEAKRGSNTVERNFSMTHIDFAVNF